MTSRPLHDTCGEANKVATVTLTFWIMKICATTVGETGGDLLSMTLHAGYAVSSLILVGFFLVTLFAQLRADRFHPLLYWAVILSTSTAGTTMSDYMDRSLGLGYATGSAILIGLLVAILTAWRLTLGSIKVDHIGERKAEVFYWAAILASNTLGTALGDYLADSSGLGYLASNLLISAGILATVAAYRFTRISRTTLFWAAFVLTRPFGATMGDLLTKSHAKGGLAFGTIGSTLALLALLAALIAFSIHQDRRAKSFVRVA
jgi:uncharacterized membrane-anchored protein